MRKFLVVLVILLVIFAAAWGAFLVEAPLMPGKTTLVNFPTGTPARKIASTLQQKGVIRSSLAFLAYHSIVGGTLKAGEYRFDHAANLPTVYGRILHGDVYTINITIPEGDNIFDIARRLAAAKLTTKAAFLKVAENDTSLVRGLDPHAPSLEGYLFPDTYKFTPGVSAHDIARLMVQQFRVEAAKLGLVASASGAQPGSPAQAKTGKTKSGKVTTVQTKSGKKSKSKSLTIRPTIHNIVTVASIVERETPIPSERPLVASVFYNRLRKQIPLMTDTSVIYAAILQHKYHGTIYESDLKSNSPYNTYTHLGLPPGPICNPGLGSLRAAMHPANTDYLYFVAAGANPSGHSRFSATLAQHQKDVAAYRKAVREAKHH